MLPECVREESLPPCEHDGRRFWRCRLPTNSTSWQAFTTWKPWEGYNSTVMCYEFVAPRRRRPRGRMAIEGYGTDGGLGLGPGKTRAKRSQGRPDQTQCTQCLQSSNRIKFKMGKPGSCTQHNLPNCTFGSRNPMTFSQCSGPQGVICYLPRSTGLDQCEPCLNLATLGRRTIITLVYHTQLPADCTPQTKTCLYNGTMYNYCFQQQQLVCYRPETPIRLQITVLAGLALTLNPAQSRLYLLTNVSGLKQGSDPLKVNFDVCNAMDKVSSVACGSESWRSTYKNNHKYLCERQLKWAFENPDRFEPCALPIDHCCDHTGGGYQGCPHLSDFRRVPNSNNVTFLVSRNHPPVSSYGLGIDGTGHDPVTYITIRAETVKEGQVKSLGWSVYDDLGKLEEPMPISPKAKNLFVEMAELVAKTLTVKNCFVCGGTNMGEQWPWEALEAYPAVYNNMSRAGNITARTAPSPRGSRQSRRRTNLGISGNVWALTSNLVGRNCFAQNGSIPVGHLICLGQWDSTYKQWSSPSNLTQPDKFDLTFLAYLNASSPPTSWVAPANMYWICGNLAYELLPANWSGSCVLGWIKPSFFLLPIQSRQVLGVPVYDRIGKRKRRAAYRYDSPETAFSDFPCKDLAAYESQDTSSVQYWTNERIVCTYGRATWAEDGSWGYRTPVYMLNRIIRLQAVLDMAGERINKALKVLSATTDRLRTAVYQNRLALDYILAKEGGVCGKFNLSNCCLQIDETGKVINQLTTEIRQLTHNPTQVWKGFNFADTFSSWLPKLPGLQTIIILAAILILGCLILPCLLPLCVHRFSSMLSLMVDRRATVKALAVWDYMTVSLSTSSPSTPTGNNCETTEVDGTLYMPQRWEHEEEALYAQIETPV